jgi:hypothetical protein
VRALCLSETGLDAVARELTRSLGVDWQYAPFTRCLVDNTALRTATAGEAAGVPERSRAAGGRVTRCPSCGRLYWEGGHHRRMRAMLARFATGGE